MNSDHGLHQISLLLKRLERLSADSLWSHRASGIRGSLIEYLESYAGHPPIKSSEDLDDILGQGYYILEQAARHNFSSCRIKVKVVVTEDEFSENESVINI